MKKDIFANRFRQPVYDPKNLINFKRKNVWMNGMEKHSFAISNFQLFCILCGCMLAYFLTRGLW